LGLQATKEFEMRKLNKRALRPTPALVVAFVALFAAMGGFGYAAAKLKPASVKTKNIRAGAVTTDKLADGAVTTPKLAPDAVAPYAMNAAKVAGVAPGECQPGWLSGSLTADTVPLNGTLGEPTVVPGFNCASKAGDAVQIQREAVGQYEVILAGNDSRQAIASSTGANAVVAAGIVKDQNGQPVPGHFLVKVWNNADAQFVDGKAFSLMAF
jgi:hypothetical protein